VPPPTCTTETEYAVAPADAVQLSVGVSVATVVPGCGVSPGDKPAGVAGADSRLTVKNTAGDVALEPTEFEADTDQLQVSPSSSATGQGMEVEVVENVSAAPPSGVTVTEYAFAPGDALHVSVGVSVARLLPGCDGSPGERPIGAWGALTRKFKDTPALVPAEFAAVTSNI